ncbi:MAG TPA: putative toxin-antitoxin system toxin component, PIN family [Phycisphaerae bacterium]|nr:putative toxin-antitoxin system toxin component, PIN family [Phycisphaerae bacterium]
MRIVLDTNVLLSGVFTRGLCEALLDACLGCEECTVVLSEPILHEFARHAAKEFGAPAGEVRGAVEFLRSHVSLVEPAKVSPDACRDANDLAVLGTAVAAAADCLVTGDSDLLDLREFRGVPIISPRTFHYRVA